MKEYICRKAKQEELETCTDLANLAFGFDFRTLLPKAFGKNPVMQTSNYVADNGELKGLVSVLGERLTGRFWSGFRIDKSHFKVL